MSKLNQLRALIIATSAYYGHRLDDHVVNMYAEDLADLTFEQVHSALQEIRRDPRISRFPLPAVIRNKIAPGILEDDVATEAAARIVTALSRYGSSNLDSAKAFIGELGWAVVNRQGGWDHLCQTVTNALIPTYQAQWRELAKSLRRRAQQGLLDVPPALLDSPKSKQDLTSISLMLPHLIGSHKNGDKE